LIDRVEERLPWLRVWLMSTQRRTNPGSLKIAGTQSRKFDQLGQE